MYNKINKVFYMVLFFTMFIAFPNIVSALNHKLDIEAYVCDPDKYNNATMTTNYKNCMSDYLDGKMKSAYQRNNGDEVDPGSLMIFVVKYHVGSTHNVTGINVNYYYDPSVWTPGTNNSGAMYTNNTVTNKLKAQWPEYAEDDVDEEVGANWDYTQNLSVDDNAYSFVIVNGENVPFYEDVDIGIFPMILSDSASGNVGLSVGTANPEDAFMNDFDANPVDFDFDSDYNGISFKVAGEALSTDATLGTLTVKNNNVDYMNPTFISGSENLSYTVYVPYSVDQIDLQATAHDANATIGDEFGTGLGVKDLDVGAQVYNIVVYSKAGNSLTYSVTVYRLSNDATLQNITFTNGVFTINPSQLTSKFNYDSTTAYQITSTDINATPTHKNGAIESGTGTWNLTGVGASNKNVRNVVVLAEDCAHIDETVNGVCTKQTYTFNVVREEASVNTFLASITKRYNTESSASLLPGYNKNVTEYDLGEVPYEVSSMTLNATVEATGKAKIQSGSLGNKSLQVGDNEFKIVVIAEDNETKTTYTVKVHRKSNNNNLKLMDVTSTPTGSELNIPLDNNLTSYTYKYIEGTTTYTVSATVDDTDKASVAIVDANNVSNGVGSTLNSASYTFDITTTKVNVIVTSENGDVKTYEINIARKQSTDTTLKSLEISSGSGADLTEYTLSPEFPSDTRNYYLTVESEISEVNINAIPTSENAKGVKITGNYNNLAFDTNLIEITVTAEDDSTSAYNVYITRKKYDIKTLSSLSVTADGVNYEITPELNEDTDEYELVSEIPYDSKSGGKIEQITINATPTDENFASVSGNGVQSIHTGNQTYKIVVTAHNETTREYKLKVKQKQNGDNSIDGLYIKGIAPTLIESGADIDTYEISFANDVTSIKPSDVIFSIPVGATKSVTQTLELQTKVNNVYTFTVTSESGLTHTYNVNITRRSSNDNSISLVSVTVDSDSLTRTCTMNADNECTIEVPTSTLNFTVNATIASTASINPANNLEYSLPASTSQKQVPLTVTSEGGDIANYTLNIIRAKSSNNDLSSITINGQTISQITNDSINTHQTFNKNTNTYNITLVGETESITVAASVEDTDKAKIDIVNATDGFDENNLNYEFNTRQKPFNLTQEKVNVIRIYVIAENNQTKYYTLNITRALRKNAYLSLLNVNGVLVNDFNKETTEYTLNKVNYNTTSITIYAQTEDPQASKGGDGVIYLHTGLNEIPITVTAQDMKTTKEYIIKVTRDKNNDAGIKGIKLANNDATCDFTTNVCNVTVPNFVTEANQSNLVVDVNDPKMETDAKATVSFEDTYLFTEDNHPNVIKITVTAEDNTSKEYTLNVTRTKSNIATLSNITIESTTGVKIGSFGLKPFIPDEFIPDEDNANQMTYNVSVPVDTTEFVIKYVKTEPHETVSGDGRYTLNTTSEDSITEQVITVTSEDNLVVHNYLLKISREKSSDNFLSNISVTSVDDSKNYPLNETFKQDKNIYSVNVAGDVEEVKINATLSDLRSSIEDEENILTTHPLQVGDNQFNIKVMSESGSPNTYTLNIIRAKKPYNDLKELVVDSNTLLDKENSINLLDENNTYTFEQNVGYDTTRVPIVANKEDADASVKIVVENEAGVKTEVTTGNVTLSTGLNVITVSVTAQNNEVKEYKIKITRNKNNDATLRTITVLNVRGNQSEVITIEEGVYRYSLEVEQAKAILKQSEVSVGLNDNNASYELDSDMNLITSDPGEYPNSFNIKVTAEDGETIQNYQLIIRRPKSSDARIESITLVGASNESQFDKDTFEYTLDIPYNRDTFTISSTPYVNTTLISGNNTYKYNLDENKKPYITYTDDENNEQRIEGSKITLVGTAEDGSHEIYTFNIVSAKSEDTVITNLYVQDQPFTENFRQTVNDYTLKNNLEVSQDALRIVAERRNDNAIYVCIIDGMTYDCQNEALPIPPEATTKTITVRIISASGTKTKDYRIKYTKVLSNDADLSTLSVVDPSINIGFNRATNVYGVNVGNEVESAKLRFTTSDINATVSIDGVELVPTSHAYEYVMENLQVGNNKVRIDITAQDGKTTNYYELTLKRAPEAASNDAYLSSLAVKDYPFIGKEFNMEETSYTIGEIPYKLDKLEILATANYAKSNITYNLDGENAQSSKILYLPIEEGTHTIYVNVTAEDTTLKTYTITYNKTPNRNNKLTSITLDRVQLDFNPTKNVYDVTVSKDITSMIATIIVASPLADVEISSSKYSAPNTSAIVYNIDSLQPGNNVFQVKVIAEDGTPNVYSINIKREQEQFITSQEYGHTIENGMIKTVKVNDNILDMKNQLDNDNAYLEIWNAQDTKQLSETDKVATGQIVKLIIDGVEYDRKYIVVLGDTDGNGNITPFDAVKVINHYLEKTYLVGPYLQAADTDKNTNVTPFDAVKIINHYLEKSSLFN